MEKSLRKRSAVKRIGKNNMQNMMQMKPAKTPKAESKNANMWWSKWTSKNLSYNEKTYCSWIQPFRFI